MNKKKLSKASLSRYAVAFSLMGALGSPVHSAEQVPNPSVEPSNDSLKNSDNFVTSEEGYYQDNQETQAVQSLKLASERLERLAAEADEDELAPTTAAKDRCKEVFSSLPSDASWVHDLPKAILTGMGDGDIHCEWKRGDKRVLTLISPEGDLYLHQIIVRHGRIVTQEDYHSPSMEQVHSALQWISE